MKIRPTSRCIREQVSDRGHAVLLLGVRRDKSSRRAQSVAKYHDNLESHLSVHNDHRGCGTNSARFGFNATVRRGCAKLQSVGKVGFVFANCRVCT